jgi:hypothetical protein
MKLVALASLGYAGLGCALLLAGCGEPPATGPDRLTGADVATMAESELEAENPSLTTGMLTCPDLDFAVGASVRCLRTTELSGGRVVKVRGTVTVTSVESGGRLHVVMDEQPAEFGLTGSRVAVDVRERYQRRYHARPRRVDCPYLRGEVGTTITCRVVVAGTRHHLDVQVTDVEPEGFATSYVVKTHPGAD